MARNGLWVLSGRVAGIAGTALVALSLPRCLAPVECGRFLFAQNLLSIACLFATAGLPLAAVKVLSERLAGRDALQARTALHTILRLGLATSILATFVATSILAFVGPRWLSMGTDRAWLWGFGAALILLAWQGVLTETMRGLGELRWASLFAGGQSGGPIATLAFTLALWAAAIWIRPTAAQTLAIFASSLLLTLPMIFYGMRLAWHQAVDSLIQREPNRTTPVADVASVLRVSLPICVTQTLAYLTLSTDLLMAGVFCQPSDIALLGQARRLLLVLQIPTQVAVMTLLPSVAQLLAQGDVAAVERLVRRAASLSLITVLPAAVVLLVSPASAMAALFGAFYRQGAPLLVALVLGQLFAIRNGMAGYVLIMAGQWRAVVLANALTAMLMILTGIIAVRSSGVLGLAVAAAAVLALQTSLERYFSRKLLGIRTHADWRMIVPIHWASRKPIV